MCAVIMAMIMAASCSTSSPPVPTKDHPIPSCVISCPDGFVIEKWNKCRADRRWFADVLLVGEYVSRGVDGTISIDSYVDNQGELHDKHHVVYGTCQSYILTLIQQRDPRERGQHPGETPDGRPQP